MTIDFSWFGRTYHARLEALEDPSGRVIGCVGVALDITDRASAEARLRDGEARFRRIFDSNMIGIVFWKRDGRIVDANRAFFELVGYTRDDLEAGRISWRDLTPAEYSGADEHALAEMNAEATCTPFEKEYIRRDGTRVPILLDCYCTSPFAVAARWTPYSPSSPPPTPIATTETTCCWRWSSPTAPR